MPQPASSPFPFPADVTLVVQVGLTDPTQYEHRVGRTGRAGKTGEALLLMSEDEAPGMLKGLQGMPLHKAAPNSAVTAGAASSQIAPALAAALQEVSRRGSALNTAANQGFIGTVGFYNSNLKRMGWSKQDLVDKMRAWFASLGLTQPEPVPAKTLGE